MEDERKALAIVAYWKRELDKVLDVERVRIHLKTIREWEARWKR